MCQTLKTFTNSQTCKKGPALVLGTGDMVTTKTTMVSVGSEGRRLGLNNLFLRNHLIVGIVVLVAQSCPTLLQSPWTVARQDPLSMKFSRQEYCSGLPFPSPGDLPDPGIKPRSSALQADSLPSEPPGKPPLCTGVYKSPAVKAAVPNLSDCF